jgi:hypothetical protein
MNAVDIEKIMLKQEVDLLRAKEERRKLTQKKYRDKILSKPKKIITPEDKQKKALYMRHYTKSRSLLKKQNKTDKTSLADDIKSNIGVLSHDELVAKVMKLIS